MSESSLPNAPLPARPRPTVTPGARIRDGICGETHVLTRPPGVESDALLVYECTARGAYGAAARHTGAILGLLVDGLERVED
jgi:hypothetical protein